MRSLNKLLPELKRIETFAAANPDIIRIETLGMVEDQHMAYPIYGLVIGSEDKTKPTVCITGGVHGLERIGTQVILSYFNTIEQRLKWDSDFKEQLKTRRIIAVPIVNPWGMAHHRRSNVNGVDLMRNAPLDAVDATWLVGGHRISPALPWYRGEEGAPMELESQSMIDFIQKETDEAEATILLDMHSGFGTKDQLWFPYAYSNKDRFPHIQEFKKLRNLFEDTYPHHIYKIEPQAVNYTTHGDLWDYLILERKKKNINNIFIPLTLELGSWIWVKKNPIQIFKIFGIFNPVKEHRFSRVMRRHIYFFDFLFRAIKNSKSWS
jgi:hypothetical protein